MLTIADTDPRSDVGGPKTIARDPRWPGPAVSPGDMLSEEFLQPLGISPAEAVSLGSTPSRTARQCSIMWLLMTHDARNSHDGMTICRDPHLSGLAVSPGEMLLKEFLGFARTPTGGSREWICGFPANRLERKLCSARTGSRPPVLAAVSIGLNRQERPLDDVERHAL